MEVTLSPAEYRRILERAIVIDDHEAPPYYLNINDVDEVQPISVFTTREEAKAQREIVIDTLVSVLSKG